MEAPNPASQRISARKIDPGPSGRDLAIQWSDGSLSLIPYIDLRFYCPCAGCVDEHSGERTIHRKDVAQDVRPLGIQPVGRYAIQIQWSDRHQTGIYHFETLRAIVGVREHEQKHAH